MSRQEIRQSFEDQFCPSWVPQTVRDQVWAKAWEDGHASGAYLIEQIYDELMELIRPLAFTQKEGE